MKDYDIFESFKFIYIFGIIAILFLLGVLFDTGIYQNLIKEECTNQGMIYYYSDNIEYCIDNSNTAHRVFFECEGILWNKVCTHRFINIIDGVKQK